MRNPRNTNPAGRSPSNGPMPTTCKVVCHRDASRRHATHPIKMPLPGRGTLVLALACLTLGSCVLAGRAPSNASPGQVGPRDQPGQPEQPGPAGIERAIEVVQSKSGVYVYTYAETMDDIDPKKDYVAKYRVFDEPLIARLRKAIAENRDYSPEFKARCLPMWEYGLEFREPKATATFLFSFRCNTIRYVEGNLFKDFTPQRAQFFQFFRYEVRPETASLLEKK